MIKTIASLEVKIGERIYKLLCDADSPLGEVHDVINQMKNFVIKRITDANAEQNPAPVVNQDAVQEPVPVVEPSEIA